MSIQEVPQGRLRTPFDEGREGVETLTNWREWKG